eukprot:5393643-Amphidinium_carterae.1
MFRCSRSFCFIEALALHACCLSYLCAPHCETAWNTSGRFQNIRMVVVGHVSVNGNWLWFYHILPFCVERASRRATVGAMKWRGCMEKSSMQQEAIGPIKKKTKDTADHPPKCTLGHS